MDSNSALIQSRIPRTSRIRCGSQIPVPEHSKLATVSQCLNINVPLIWEVIPHPGQHGCLVAAGVQMESSALIFQQSNPGNACLGWRLLPDLLQTQLEVPRESEPWQRMRGRCVQGWIAAHRMLRCSKTAWNAPKPGAGG